MPSKSKTEAAIFIASPEMCESNSSFSFIGQVCVKSCCVEENVQLVAVDCRKCEEIPGKLRSILQEMLPQREKERLFIESHLNRLCVPVKNSGVKRLERFVSHPNLSVEQMLYVGD